MNDPRNKPSSGINDPGTPGEENAPRRSALGPILALLTIIILVLTAAAILNALNQAQGTQVARLQTIADLKVRQIAEWLQERQFDAETLATSEYLSGLFRRWRAGDAASGEKLQARLHDHTRRRSFAAVTLLDHDGQRLWGSEQAPQQVASLLLDATGLAARTGRVQRIGPYLGLAGHVRFDYIVPLASGFFVLHANPRDWLYTTLQTWPVPSPSGESLLFRRDGDDVLYLNELRHRPDAALKLRLPLATRDLLGAQVLRGEAREGKLVTGHDYRFVPAVGVTRAVPGSDWFLIAKVDRDEMYGEVIGEVAWIGLAGTLLVFALGAGLVLLRQRERLAGEMVAREAQTERLHLFDNMMNGFAYCRMLYENDQPVDFIYLSVNKAFETQTGLRDVVGRRVSEVIPGIRELDPTLFEIYGRVARSGCPERFEIYLNTSQLWFDVSAYCPRHEHFTAIFDVITERKRADAQLHQSEAQLHALAAKLQTVREEERTRLARNVHDDLGQQLTGLSLDLAWLEKRVARITDAELRQSMEDKITEIEGLTQTMLASVQEIASELRPDALDHLGLCAALRQEAERFTRRSNILCVLDLPASPSSLSPDTATALFRIVQECLTNVARHSGAARVDIRFAASGNGVMLEVRDNGRGISSEQLADPASLGLVGMRERAAQLGGVLSIVGEPGRGTTVTVTVTVPA